MNKGDYLTRKSRHQFKAKESLTSSAVFTFDTFVQAALAAKML